MLILDGANGKWSYSARLDRAGNLYGAAARSREDAWLVGQHAQGYPTALHRTENAWQRVHVPHANEVFWLAGVDVVPETRQAWAVGSHFTLRWRHGQWNDVANAFGSDVTLNAVEAVSRTDVWVVGWRIVAGTQIDQETFIAHWDGSGWQVSPTGTGHVGSLEAVAAVDSQDVWAGGGSDFLHWNGSTWTESRCREGRQPCTPSREHLAHEPCGQ